ncbi:hypothetical protein [Deinococcus sp.]|uniref:hypothetical protein n=1 Tax=Deinococcus sp. TaxID=47478 RepID=UPI0025E30E49|nr:hypothetical protein [Deinococcus sp.]
MPHIERAEYRLVIASQPQRETLVTELTLGERLFIEIYLEKGRRELAIFSQGWEGPLTTSAEVFLEFLQKAVNNTDLPPEKA